MEVKVFDPDLSAEDVVDQPHEVLGIEGTDQGLKISPESIGSVGFSDIHGLAVFRSLEEGPEKTFLLLVAGDLAQPLVVEARQIRFADFPIRRAPSAAENLRQLVLYICQRADRMVMDRVTGTFLQQGGPAPPLEHTVLSMATAFGRIRPSKSSPEPRDPAPAVLAGPALDGSRDGGLPRPAPRPEVEKAPEAPYSALAALTYPLRGLCFMVFAGMIVFLVATMLLSAPRDLENVAAVPAPSPALALLSLVMLWLMPPTLFGIIRSTAYGDNTLEELPNYFDFMSRIGDLASYFLASVIPAAFAVGFYLVLLLLAVMVGPAGLILLGAGAFVVYLAYLGVWMLALGSAAIYNDYLTPIRIDLHFRALLKCWKSVLGIFGGLLAFSLLGGIVLAVATVFAPLPSVDSTAGLALMILPATVLTCYVLLDGFHLLGLLFRRNEEKLAAIYLYK